MRLRLCLAPGDLGGGDTTGTGSENIPPSSEELVLMGRGGGALGHPTPNTSTQDSRDEYAMKYHEVMRS